MKYATNTHSHDGLGADKALDASDAASSLREFPDRPDKLTSSRGPLPQTMADAGSAAAGQRATGEASTSNVVAGFRPAAQRDPTASQVAPEPRDSRIRFELTRPEFALEVNLSLPARGITVLFGPSGSGKTSFLRCVAGLERPRQSYIRIGHEVWQDDSMGRFLPTWRRAVGYVFQEASLFDHLSVRGNLEYGLRRVRPRPAPELVDAAIELLGIGSLLDRRPNQLSGGERQRVAIARALAAQPKVLLLDEPLASLDYARRQEILPWLERLRDQLDMPMFYVTHAADEVARLADFLVMLEGGKVHKVGPATELLPEIHAPIRMGDDVGTILEGTITQRETEWQLARVDFAGGSLWIADPDLAVGTRVRLNILARDVSITTERPGQTSILNHVQAVIESLEPGAHEALVIVRARCKDAVLLARVTRRSAALLGLRPDLPVWLQIKSAALAR